MANDHQNNDFRRLVEITRSFPEESGYAHDVYNSVTPNSLSDDQRDLPG